MICKFRIVDGNGSVVTKQAIVKRRGFSSVIGEHAPEEHKNSCNTWAIAFAIADDGFAEAAL